MKIDIETAPISSLPVLPGNFLTLYDFAATLDIAEFSPGTDTSIDVVVEASGDVLVGGANGFLCKVQGSLDTSSGEGTLHVEHAGGWAPLPGDLGTLFKTPAFSGGLVLNQNDVYLFVYASVDFKQPIKVLPNMLEFTGYPPDRTAAGPIAMIEMTKATEDSSARFIVNLQAAIRIGSGQGAPPLIMINGTLDTCGVSELYIATETVWQPLPSVLPGLQIPQIWGYIAMHPDGEVEFVASHSPLPDINLGSILSFTGWYVAIEGSASPTVPHGTAECEETPSDDPPAKDAVTPTAPSPPPSYDMAVKVNVSGGITIGGAFELSVFGTIDTEMQTTEIVLTHAGGWCPFDFISFCTPYIEGFFKMSTHPDAEAYLEMGAVIKLSSPIAIIPGLVEVLCPEEGCNDGPQFGVTMNQKEKNGPRFLSVYFAGSVCLKLTSQSYCLLVEVSADAEGGRRRRLADLPYDRLGNRSRSQGSVYTFAEWPEESPEESSDEWSEEQSDWPVELSALTNHAAARQLAAGKASGKSKGLKFKGFTITGSLVSGDLYPLSVIPFLSFMEDFIVIRATYEFPLSISLTITPGDPSPKFQFIATLTFNPPSFLGMGQINLPVDVEGTLGSGGPKAVFKTPALPDLEIPGLVTFKGLRLFIATGDGIDITTESGTQVQLDKGFVLLYEGDTPLSAICPLKMVLLFAFESLTKFSFTGHCSGFALMMLHKPPIQLPSINFLRFDSISLYAGIAPSLVEFGVGTTFALATGSSYCLDGLEAECIQAELEVKIGVTPAFIIISLKLPTSGIWIDPLGLRNFAVINPSLEFELQITQSVPPVPTPRKVAWAITILYKMPWLSSWPDSLRYRDAPHPAYYRPDLTPYTSGKGDLRQLSSFFLYEQWHPEIDDLLCLITGLPRFAVKVVVPKLSFIQLFMMAADIIFSMVSAASQQSIHTPPALGSLLQALDEFLKIEMSLYFELSLIESPAVPEWSGEPVMRGIYLNTTAHAAFLGFVFDFRCEAKLQIPTPSPADIPRIAQGFVQFFSNPMGALTGEVDINVLNIDFGILIEAKTVLPLGIGEAYFFGKISFAKFELRGHVIFQVGPFSLNANLEFVVSLSVIQLEFNANMELGPLGAVAVHGKITSDPPSFYLNGTLCVDLLGLQMSGYVITCAGGEQCEADGYFGFDLLSRVGFLGEIHLAGAIAVESGDVVVAGKARVEVDFGELASQIVDVVIYLIAGSSSPAASLVGEGLKWLFSLLDLVRFLEVSYDSRESEILVTVGVNIPFSGPRAFGPLPLPLPFRRRLGELPPLAGEQLPDWPHPDDFSFNATRRRALSSHCEPSSEMTMKDMVMGVESYLRNPAKLFAEMLGPVEFEFAFEVKAFVVGLAGSVHFNLTETGDLTLELEASMSFLGIGLEGACKLSSSGGVVSGHLIGYGSTPTLCGGCPALSGRLEAHKFENGTKVLNMDVQMSLGCLEIVGNAAFDTDGGLTNFLLSVRDPTCIITELLDAILGVLGLDVSIDIGIDSIHLIHTAGGSVTFEINLNFFGWTTALSFTASAPINQVSQLLSLIVDDPIAVVRSRAAPPSCDL